MRVWRRRLARGVGNQNARRPKQTLVKTARSAGLAAAARLFGFAMALACVPPDTSGICGPGSWQPGFLEIHHLDLGQADATLIVSPSGRSMLVDAGEESPISSAGAQRVGAYLEATLGCRRIDFLLLTHFHLDHVGFPEVGGVWHLVEAQGFRVGRTIHRDLRAFPGEWGPVQQRWLEYLDGRGSARLQASTVARGMPIDLGPELAVRVVAADGQGLIRPRPLVGAAPSNENDFSVALVLRFGALDYFLGGDLSGELAPAGADASYHDIETAVAGGLPDLDVYRVDHHGSDHSSNPTFLAQTAPEVAIVSVGNSNRYGHPRPATLDRLAARGAVYLTERGDPTVPSGAAHVAGDVVLRSADGRRYTVAGSWFRATDPPRVDGDGDGYFLEADPDDQDPARRPGPRGGCDPLAQSCAPSGW